ncbi:MAG: beta-ketoacyl-ACP synthase III [Sneathiella sp.]|nr:beta-ketoacyl-ACP synthase III [Sneathiella sp.]
MRDVYITSAGGFLPGSPITNSQMEEYLGYIKGKPSRFGKMILRQNGIQTRHYALDTDGKPQYSSAEMAANAIHTALERSTVSKDRIEFLSTATTQGDTLVPGFASLVHHNSDLPPMEIASFQSVCASGMMALKNAYLNLKAGEKETALSVASEFSSRWFRPGFYEDYLDHSGDTEVNNDAEFLRWTLSDGAGALFLETDIDSGQDLALKIDWIDLCSYADRYEPCMYAGTATNDMPSALPWASHPSPSNAAAAGAIMLKQDFDLLYRLFPTWVGHYLSLVEKGQIKPEKVTHFLPHYSANSLRQRMVKLLEKTGSMIPESKWFNNLTRIGNTGSASIYLMLEELMRTENLTEGDQILCFVPESGQCIVSFMQLTVVRGK